VRIGGGEKSDKKGLGVRSAMVAVFGHVAMQQCEKCSNATMRQRKQQ
jgi:hypothetical protein